MGLLGGLGVCAPTELRGVSDPDKKGGTADLEVGAGVRDRDSRCCPFFSLPDCQKAVLTLEGHDVKRMIF